MKVLFIAKNIPRLGKKGNKIILTIAEKLSEFCDITILRPCEKVPFWLKNNEKFSDLYGLKNWTFKQFTITTYPYFQLPIKKAKYWLFAGLSKQGRKYVEKNNFDLVHAHYLLPDGLVAYEILKKFNIPYVLTFRNQDRQYLELISSKNPDYRKAEKILTSAKVVLTPNGGYKDFIESRFKMECKIMPHGIEQEVFAEKPEGNLHDKISILSVADRLPTKNVDWLIKAFKTYKGNKRIKLTLLGDVCNKKSIRLLAQGDKRIQLLGIVKRDKVLKYMRESNIFALPSSKETFGLVYLEAAATQNAIIGFKGEGVWGIFEENKEMLFCSDYDEFNHHFYQLIENSGLREILIKNSLRKAKTMEWSMVGSHYHELYKDALL